MLEIIVFAVALVVAQVTAGIILTVVGMKLMLNKSFLKKYNKMLREITEEIIDEMYE